ncbi:MAG: hypothetical protein ACREFV_01425 [Acetobacteraceae bacterium]
MRLAKAVRSLPASVVALGAVPLLFHLVIVETNHIHDGGPLTLGILFKVGFVTVSALAHWAIYSSLLLTFALTLRPGREALVKAVARKLHGTISNEIVIYTRTLFLFAPLAVWSFFVNVLEIPLVVAMFSDECVCRRHCLQNPPRHPLASMLGLVLDIRNRRREPASLP